MRRHRNPLRFRKAIQSNRPDRSEFSTALRIVRDSVQRRHAAEALSQIDQLLGGPVSVQQRAQLLSLAGDTLFKQGKFDEAAQAYDRGTQISATDLRAWYRPWLAEVRSLLKSANTTGAIEQAIALIAKAVSAEAAFNQLAAQAQTALNQGTPVIIPPRPPRPSVVASRLGRLFFLEGELTAAQQMYASALQANPNGGTRARLGLAEIALRRGDAAEATRLTKEALRLGQFKSKTLSGWPLLFAACRQIGADPLDPTLLSGLAQATPSVRARAILLLVRHLRQQGDARWQTLAANWSNSAGFKPPAVLAELRKLGLAHVRLVNQPAVQRLASAQSLLATPGLGPTEQLSAVKELIRAQLESNQVPALEPLITAAPARIQPDLIHSLALVCQKTGKPDLALALFDRNLTSQPPGSALWGKAVWAKARLLKSQGQNAEAAALFWSCYQQPGMTERFRLLSLMEWTRLLASVRRSDVLAMQPQIEAAYPAIQDYELVLDLARQVRYTTLRPNFGARIYERGKALALQALDSASHPSATATVLFKFCRRANDFSQYGDIIDTWEKLPAAKRAGLWSDKGDYWGWIELVFRAYRDSRRTEAAVAFAETVLTDPATPPHAYALMAVSLASLWRKQGEWRSTIKLYERMIEIAPAYEWTAVGYYWKAIESWHRGDQQAAQKYAARIRPALGNGLGLAWKQKLAASALLFDSGLDRATVRLVPEVSSVAVDQASKSITSDLARFRP